MNTSLATYFLRWYEDSCGSAERRQSAKAARLANNGKLNRVEQTLELFPDVCHFFVDPLLFELLNPARANIRNKLVITTRQRPPPGFSFTAAFLGHTCVSPRIFDAMAGHCDCRVGFSKDQLGGGVPWES